MRIPTSLPCRALVPFVAAVALPTAAGSSVAAAGESRGSIITAPLSRPVAADDPCPSTDPVACRIRVMPMDEKVEAQRTRLRYHDLLEDMHRTEANMRAAGAGSTPSTARGRRSPTPRCARVTPSTVN
ncbi:hypothetical protein ACWDX6_09735 [Streptomyces sp. NPDC003027]